MVKSRSYAVGIHRDIDNRPVLDIMPCARIYATRLAIGRLVGAQGTVGLDGLAGGVDVVARVGVEAGGLAGRGLVGACGAWRLGGLALEST